MRELEGHDINIRGLRVLCWVSHLFYLFEKSHYISNPKSVSNPIYPKNTYTSSFNIFYNVIFCRSDILEKCQCLKNRK